MSDPTPAHSGAARSGVDPYRGILWLILIAGATLRIYLLVTTHAAEEDFYITLRYAENIAAGHGFVYNIGQHVLGTTTPLYTLVLALFARVGLDPTLCGKLLGIVADLLAGLFTYRLSRAVHRPIAGLAAVICLCFAPTNLIWSIKGMEVGIVAAVAVGAWTAWVEGREVLAWICAAILVLVRIDGAVLAAIMLGATVLRDHRIPWRGATVFALLLAPWIWFASVYFGSPIPLSLGAKLTVYGRLIPGRFPRLPEFLTLMLHNPLGLVTAGGCLLYCACAFALWRKCRANDSPGVEKPHPEFALAAPLLWIGVHYAGMALSHVVLFGWYFVPPTPIYYLVAMVGISMAADRLGYSESQVGIKRAALGTAAACILALLLVGPHVATTLREGQAIETNLRIPIGVWIRDHARPGDTLMLEPIGYIGYYSRLNIVDMIGLVSPEALASYGPSVAFPDHDLWQRLHPDWILLRAGEIKVLTAHEQTLPKAQRLGETYMEVKSWSSSGNPTGPAAFTLYRRKE
jgi:hypothetical protein